jgi:hypothetical protein
MTHSRTFRRVSAALLLAGGSVGFALCLAGIVTCWVARPSLIRNGSRSCDSADKILADVADGLERTKSSLQNAKNGLASLPQAADQPGSERLRERVALLRALMPQLTPQIQDARRRLDVAADTAVIARSLLEGFEGMPLLQTTALDTDKLRGTALQVKNLQDSAEKLRDALGPDDRFADAETARFEAQLASALAKLEEVSGHVTAIRHRFQEISAKLAGWLTMAAALVTVLLVWVAVGQIGLILHGRSLRKGSMPGTTA